MLQSLELLPGIKPANPPLLGGQVTPLLMALWGRGGSCCAVQLCPEALREHSRAALGLWKSWPHLLPNPPFPVQICSLMHTQTRRCHPCRVPPAQPGAQPSCLSQEFLLCQSQDQGFLQSTLRAQCPPLGGGHQSCPRRAGHDQADLANKNLDF